MINLSFYKHLAKYSDSQYHAIYHRNEYYFLFEKTSITPKVKRACSVYKVTQLFWGGTEQCQ